jgi:hypothetical protein
METSTRIIDYHLKERIEGQNSKITSTGETVEKPYFWIFFSSNSLHPFSNLS